jgi:hypothetical protein
MRPEDFRAQVHPPDKEDSGEVSVTVDMS